MNTPAQAAAAESAAEIEATRLHAALCQVCGFPRLKPHMGQKMQWGEILRAWDDYGLVVPLDENDFRALVRFMERENSAGKSNWTILPNWIFRKLHNGDLLQHIFDIRKVRGGPRFAFRNNNGGPRPAPRPAPPGATGATAVPPATSLDTPDTPTPLRQFIDKMKSTL